MHDDNNNNGEWEKERPSILFVDDEKFILKSIGRVFRLEGYNLFFAESGPEAIRIMEKIPVDVIITDQRMPGMTGTELLKVVKERWPRTMRIILSGYSDVESLLDAINEGEVYRFVTKPWDDEALKNMVKKSIEYSRILAGFMKVVDKLREAVPGHKLEAITDVEKGRLYAEIRNQDTRLSKGQVACVLRCLLDNIDEEFKNVEIEKLSGLIARNMGKLNFTAEVGTGVQIAVDIPIEEDAE